MEKQFEKKINKQKSSTFIKHNPREIALKLLNKVTTNQAYSNILLDEELNKYNLEK